MAAVAFKPNEVYHHNQSRMCRSNCVRVCVCVLGGGSSLREDGGGKNIYPCTKSLLCPGPEAIGGEGTMNALSGLGKYPLPHTS